MNRLRHLLTRLLPWTESPDAECARVAGILQSYLDGEGSEEEAARVEAHLDACVACGFEAEALTELKDALRRHARTADADARARLEEFADRLARGEIDTEAESTGF